MKPSYFLSRWLGITLPLLLSAWTIGLHAQPGSLDPGFNAASTIGEIGFSVAVQPDGKVIAAGTFGVMRFLTDGSVDPAFKPIPGPAEYTGTGHGIGEVALQPDGRILVTGMFTNASGELLPGILRLNADGSIDPSFNLDSRVHPSGLVLALQPDGKVVTGGFYERGGEDAGSLIRLRPDGSLDPDWDARWYNNSADLVDVKLAPDGKIYFTASYGLFRVNSDGSQDTSFLVEGDVGPLGGLALQHDGKVIIGQYSDSSTFRAVRRLLPTGMDDPDWTVPTVVGGDSVVYALLVQPDGKVWVGGNNLIGFNNVFFSDIGRLNTDGSLDATFEPNGDLHYYDVSQLALAPDGKVIAAGRQLTRPDVTPAPGIWRLNNDTGMQPRLDISFTMNDGVTLRLSGQSGATYRLEYREQLPGAGSWTSLTNLTLSGTSNTWQDTNWTNSTSRFYRAVSVQ